MKRVVNIGAQDFAELVSNGDFYVDKTGLIKEWWENRDTVTLITRPRRFGKTLNMSMMEYFFSNKYADGGKIFEGLKIWEDEKFRELQGTYPVINLTFSDVKENGLDGVIEKLGLMVSELYNANDFLLESDALNESEKIRFQKICNGEMSQVMLKSSLQLLSKFLFAHYNQKVIILVDEYDTPLQEAYVNNFWDEMSDFIRGFFNSTLKTNPYLERALLTGITRVSKESIFSDLNNPEVVTISSEKYCDKFGFTVEEVRKTLEEYGLEDEAEEVRHWYDGFIFGKDTVIYNPWSIINYIDKGEFKPYWANTSSNSLISRLIRTGNEDVKTNLMNLLRGKSIEIEIDEEIVYNQLSSDQQAIWSLMAATGYLKIAGVSEKTGNEILKITNYEVMLMLKSMVNRWFREDSRNYNQFIIALLENNVKSMNAYMNRVALNMISYFDSGSKPSEQSEPERFYHGFALGLMVDLENRYVITSNRESGFGRYDISLEPKSQEDAGIIIEFKVIDKTEEEDLKATAQSALAQIEKQKYEADMKARGISEIRKYGFAFLSQASAWHDKTDSEERSDSERALANVAFEGKEVLILEG